MMTYILRFLLTLWSWAGKRCISPPVTSTQRWKLPFCLTLNLLLLTWLTRCLCVWSTTFQVAYLCWELCCCDSTSRRLSSCSVVASFVCVCVGHPETGKTTAILAAFSLCGSTKSLYYVKGTSTFFLQWSAKFTLHTNAHFHLGLMTHRTLQAVEARPID